MAGENEFRAERTAEEPNTAEMELARRRQRRAERDKLRTADLCQVTNYDFPNQRVDVVMLFERDERWENVPILASGAPVADYGALKEGSQSGNSGVVTGGTIGVLMWPRIDGTGGFDDRRTKRPRLTDRLHVGHGPWFVPREALLVSDSIANAAQEDAGVDDKDKIGPSDCARVWYPGTDDEAFYTVKEDGTHVLSFPSDAEVIIMQNGKDPSNASPVLVDGDGSIDASQSNVKVVSD